MGLLNGFSKYNNWFKLNGLEIIQFAGTPTGNGPVKGALAIDTTNGKLYINTGTVASATWSLIESLGSSIGTAELEANAVTLAKFDRSDIGKIVIAQGAGADAQWQSMSGDAIMTGSGAVTVVGANAAFNVGTNVTLTKEVNHTITVSTTTTANTAGATLGVAAGAGQGTGAGGAMSVTGGASGAGATGNGGALNLTGGAAISTAGNGGDVVIAGGVKTSSGVEGKVFTRSQTFIKQGAPAAKTTSATLTAAEVLSRIITVNQAGGATSAQQLPTVTDLETAIPNVATDDSFDFHVINTSTVDAEDASVTTNTGWTLVGNMDIHAYSAAGSLNSSAHFRARKTGAGAWTLYRVA